MADGDAPGKGRPASRGEARRQAFLKAASEVFQEQGYEAASVNEIVRRAGGSLATLYQQFGSKDHLFVAAVEDGIGRVVAPMVRAAEVDRPLEEGLQDIGEAFLTGLLSTPGLAFFRMSVGEGRKFPTVMQQFLFSGPDTVRATVANYLVVRAAEENCSFECPQAAASYFCEMVRGRHQYRALGDPAYQLDAVAISEHVKQCVRFFLRAARNPS